MKLEIKVPDSQGKFRKDLYEKSLKVIRAHKTVQPPYRAVGEASRESGWGRDQTLDDLKGFTGSE